MATLNKHARARHRRPAPRSWVAYTGGVAAVCALSLGMLAGEPPASATADPQSESVAVAAALGIEDTDVPAPAADDQELLSQLAASRAERSAEQSAAAATQAQAEESAAAAAAQAEAERKAAEAAAAERAAAEAAQAPAAADAPASAEAAPAPAPTSTVATAVAVISNSAGPVLPQAQAAADATVSNVPGAAGITIGGTRASATDPGGHPSGLALDYMVGGDSGLGDAIAQYQIDHWDELGVEYIIWQQRILQSPGGAWEYMEDRGSTTANHYDHVHVNYR